jgi:hypothetical protein
MRAYPYVFHPGVLVGAGALIVVHREWERHGAERSALYRRAVGFLGAGILSLLPTAAYVAATGQDPYQVTQGNAWQVDALVAGGILVAAGTTWLIWRRYGWGDLVPGYAEALALVVIPYILLSPFWNISGHVILATAPTVYATLVERSYWPTLAVPAVMVPNRVYLDAHTWAQSVAGLLLAAALVVGVYRLRVRGAHGPTP